MVESIVPIAGLTAAKPRTLYTEETIERIKRMVAGGYTTPAIAKAVGTTVQSLRTTCARLDISLRGPHSSPAGRKPAFKAPVRLIEPLKLYMSAEIKARLAVEADLRGISLSELCATLLAVIATDSMAKAILDD